MQMLHCTDINNSNLIPILYLIKCTVYQKMFQTNVTALVVYHFLVQ